MPMWLTRLVAVGGRRRWIVITSSKGKRSQGVGGPRRGAPGPRQRAQYSTGIYIRKLFTSAPRWNLSGFRFVGSSILSFSPPQSLFPLVFFLLRDAPSSHTRWSQREEKSCPLLSRLIRPSPEAARNYIWILIKRTSRTSTARSWFSPASVRSRGYRFGVYQRESERSLI